MYWWCRAIKLQLGSQTRNWIHVFNARKHKTRKAFWQIDCAPLCALLTFFVNALLLHPHQWHLKPKSSMELVLKRNYLSKTTHPMIPRVYWKFTGRHGTPPCFPTNFAWYLFIFHVDALLSLVPFLRVGLKVFSTEKLLFDVLLSFDLVSELLPLLLPACCCCCSSCCCWNSISVVSQMFDQIRFASPSCSSWYQATAKSMINHNNPRRLETQNCLRFFFFFLSLSLTHRRDVSRFFTIKKSP